MTQLSLDPLSGLEVFRLISGPSVLTIDCRSVLRVGLLPRSRVLRQRRNETLEQAIDRVIEEIMFDAPPEDMSVVLLVANKEANAVNLETTASYIHQQFGCDRTCVISGGAAALEAGESAYRFLLGMSLPRADALPAQLAPRLFLGSAASATDAQALTALGITHVLSVMQRKFTLAHIEPARHLVLDAGSVAREAGSHGLRSLLDESLPFVLSATETDGLRVLVHNDDGGPSAAAGIACAALVADASSELSVLQAATAIRELCPRSTPSAAVLEQLAGCEGWLREGAPPQVEGEATALQPALQKVSLGDALEASARKAALIAAEVAGLVPSAGDQSAPCNAGRLTQQELMARLPADDDDSDDDRLVDGDFAG